MGRSLKKWYWFCLFVLPTLLAFAIAIVVPFLMGLYLSFAKFKVITDATWNGVKNYVTLFTATPAFWQALLFTVGFVIVAVVLVVSQALGLALLMTKELKGTNFFRAVFFLPNLIGGIVLGYIWNLLINGVLGWWNLDITYSASFGFWGLILVLNWQMVGYMMIIFIAGLQNVPADVLEAANIDGATPAQKLFKITLPMIMPSITICLFLTISNAFKLFDQNLALTNGYPGEKTTMLALHIYKTFYNKIGYQGLAQAEAVVFSIFVGFITFLQLKMTRSKEVTQ